MALATEGGMDAETDFSPLIASVVSIQPEEFEELEQLERTAVLG